MTRWGVVGLTMALSGACMGCGSEVTTSPIDGFLWTDSEGPIGGHAMLADQSRGFRLILFLDDNGKALVYYEEGILGHGFNRVDDWADTRRRIVSSWSDDGDVLTISNLATCRLDANRSNEHLGCTLTRNVASPGATGVEVGVSRDLLFGEHAATPDDPFYDDYVPE